MILEFMGMFQNCVLGLWVDDEFYVLEECFIVGQDEYSLVLIFGGGDRVLFIVVSLVFSIVFGLMEGGGRQECS